MKTKRILLLITTLLMLALTSCEKGDITYQIKCSHSMPEIPVEIYRQINDANTAFTTTETDKNAALNRFNQICNDLQTYYDEAKGLLPWSNLDIVLELYALPEDSKTGNLIKTTTVTYRVV